ncbi:MAG: hypothetical protein H0W73_14975 [Bacteroidetes bacterium]|nr:hypothetical protein [Bacteroidota bacterium]
MEVSDADMVGSTSISFTLRSTHSDPGTGSKAVQISIDISGIITKIAIQNLDLNFDLSGEYLLFACSASKNIQFALSISENSAKFIC